MKRLSLLGLALALLGGCGNPAPASAPHAGEKDNAVADAGQDDHADGGHSEGKETHAEGQVKLSPEALKAAGVELAAVEFAQVQASLQVPGTVASTANGRAVVTPPVAGRILSISVQLGDRVNKGQVLATLDSPELAQAWSSIAEATQMRDAAAADLQRTTSEVELARAKLRAAQISRARQSDLAKAGAFSQAPIQLAQSELNEAQSELLSVQKEQASHAEQLRRLENLFREGIVSKLDLEAARLELQQDQIRMDRAAARIENARATYNREKNIGTRGLLNAKELQTAEADVRSSQLELERSKILVRSAASALSSANRAISNAQSIYRSISGSGLSSGGRVALVAPIAGTVTHLDVTQGQAVDRTQALLEVENLQTVWVSANVPEQDSAKVRKDAPVRVSLASLPGQEFMGVVQVVGSRVDPKTRSIPALCLIEGASGKLKPGMFATVYLGVGASSRELAVPKSAILTEGAKTFVFVAEGEALEKREVTLGASQDIKVTVKTGLKLGDRVAAKGAFVLSSEQKKDELKGHEH